jgi:4-diphosphocytidyl-2-C-methyl-D-erythritol kinase
MAILTLPAPAKLNLFLHITGRRGDGYHQLQTLFQFLDYSDQLDFKLRSDQHLGFDCDDPSLCGDQNLVLRAARLMAERYPNHPGVDIFLHKKLPYGGGLGGGSSDAATTLLALRQLWDLAISDHQLADIGLQLGADVPVFVHGHAAFAEGIGDQLQLATPAQLWYLVVHPNVHVATAEIFRHPDLPRQHAHLHWPQWSWDSTSNDCQQLVGDLYPEVAKALEWLVHYAPVRMTGTGACIFGRFEQEGAAREVLHQLPSAWRGFVARGCNESPVCHALRQAATVNLTNQD